MQRKRKGEPLNSHHKMQEDEWGERSATRTETCVLSVFYTRLQHCSWAMFSTSKGEECPQVINASFKQGTIRLLWSFVIWTAHEPPGLTHLESWEWRSSIFLWYFGFLIVQNILPSYIFCYLKSPQRIMLMHNRKPKDKQIVWSTDLWMYNC